MKVGPIKVRWLALLVLLLSMSACTPKTYVDAPPPAPKLSIINIIDQNDLTETISTPDRIKQFEHVNFQQNHPYKKVMRIYQRDYKGDVNAYLHTYHSNGQPWQYLVVVNGRAFGPYIEWHPNGKIKIEATVIGGEADLTTGAQKTWLFDGVSLVWDEQGKKLAELPYSKGLLEGESKYFHAGETLWKSIPCHQGLKEGLQQFFFESGELFSEAVFINDNLHGMSRRYWRSGDLAAEEEFYNGKLSNGSYWDTCGTLIAQVISGTGKRVLFGKNTVSLILAYQNGIPDGKTELYSNEGRLISYYYQKDDVKHGVEYQLFPGTQEPKLMLTWYQGKIQGPVKSWYKNGQLENQREMSENTKNGLLTAWYLDGSLMMIEEYDHNKLMRGEYYRKGEKYPVTEVIKGSGTVTIFDAEGTFLRRIAYVNGQPDSV